MSRSPEPRTEPERSHWRTASELPPYVYEAMRKPGKAIDPIAIVATVDPDGAPRTAPFGSLRAVSPGRVRFGCYSGHDTNANLLRDGRVSVAFVAPPDIAVSVTGRAEPILEGPYCFYEVDILEVKNDMMRRGAITGCIGFAPAPDQLGIYMGLIEQVEKA